MNDTDKVLSLLGLLYDAALDNKKWILFLEKLCRVFNAFGAQLSCYDSENEFLNFTYFYGVQDGEKYLPVFLKHAKSDLRYGGLPGIVDINKLDKKSKLYKFHKNGLALPDRHGISEKELHSSDMYKYVLKPMGIEYSLCAWIDSNLPNITSLAIFRGPNDKPWTEKESDILNQFVPHIKKAIAIHKRLFQLDFERRTALKSLDNLNIGLILIDKYHAVLYSNQYANKTLMEDDGLWVHDQKLRCSHRKDQTQLNNVIQSTFNDVLDGYETKSHALTVVRPSGKRAYSLLVSAVWNNLIQIESTSVKNPIVSIFVYNPDTGPNTQANLLRELYQLTKTESLVLECLVQGENVKQIAQMMQVQENTVRKHLKNIYSKTDTSSQAELIQQVLSNPIWLGTHAFSVK